MDIPKQLKELINASGILAELAKIHYDSLIKAGFGETQALYLTGEIVKENLRIANTKTTNPNTEEE